jgi:hypothetical protein
MYNENKSAIRSPCVYPFFDGGKYNMSADIPSRGFSGFSVLSLPIFISLFSIFLLCVSVSRFQEKEKGGEMITINDNIK